MRQGVNLGAPMDTKSMLPRISDDACFAGGRPCLRCSGLVADILRMKYPDMPADHLYDTWAAASRGLPMANSLVTGSWKWDLPWWPEGCWSNQGVRSIKDL